MATRQEIAAAMTANTQPVYAVAFSLDGKLLAAAGGNGMARLWNPATQTQVGSAMNADHP